MARHHRGRRVPGRPRLVVAGFEALEGRILLSGWSSYAGNPQHTALSAVPSQSLDQIAWQTPVDLAPQYSGSDLLIHYGSPLVTSANTVLVPVKTGASGGFEVRAFSGADGTAEWTLASDYLLPPHDWTPSFSPVLTPTGRLYFAGAGGTLYSTNSPDSPTATTTAQVAFYGLGHYTHAGFDSSVYVSTPLTSDANGDIFFGFQVTGSNPLNLTSGIARIAPDGTGTWVSATAASGDSGLVQVPQNCAPALSADGKTLYIAVSSGNFGRGDLLALNSTTLATIGKVALIDPATGQSAQITDDSTASPTVGPDGDVYYGVLENPFASNHDRGWLLHFSGDLTQTKIPGAFGWDDTASIVPSSMVPSYTGTSSYLLMTKYNNYADYGGGGQNKIAILDPTAMAEDPVTGACVMKEVETILGQTPDPEFDQQDPGAVREWCINSAAVDPATDSVLVNSEDGTLYRWDLANDTFSQKIALTSGLGEAYTPTLIGADGTVYAISDAKLFAVKASSQPAKVIDDSGTGFATTGTWTQATGAGDGGESQVAASGTGGSTSTWSLVLAPGTYRVSATWATDPSRATNAPFTIASGSTVLGSFAVDQQDAPSTFTAGGTTWQDLGGPVMVTGTTLVITLSNNANGTVDADAIRVERLASGQPFAVGGDSTVNPDQFQVTTFATGLNDPTGMIRLSDGSVLVATSAPNGSSTNFYNTTGQLIRLVDANGDGVADGPGTALASGLPGSLSSLAQAGPYILTTSVSPTTQILFLHAGATPSSPLTPAGSIQFSFPGSWEHTSYALATRPTPGQPGSYDVLFNIGSQHNGITTDANGNIVPEPTTGTATASGLISGTLQGDSIYMVTLADNNGTPVLSNLRQVATGLRNAASMAFDPATGDLLLADNGIDGIPDPTEAYSADTLQRIPAANIGVVVPNFGFPYTYTLTNTTPGGAGTRVNPSGGVAPIAAFEPLVDPLLPTTGSESEGASGFAVAPASFPAGLNNGVFIGFHGQFNYGGYANEENPLLYADKTTGHYFDFVSNDLPNIGHFDGAMSSPDSLFLADISSTGNIFSQDGDGAIYQIRAIPTASATFVKQDTTTQGNWKGTYGSQVYDLAVAGSSLPSADATMTVTGGTPASWATSTTDPRGLQDPNDSGRSASTWYTFNTMTFDVNITDAQAHRLELYAVDWNGRGTQEQVQVIDPASGKVLDTETLSNFGGGDYLQWTITGHVQVVVTRLAGPTAIVSGLFLDPPPPSGPTATASFNKSDATTQGNWKGAYGSQGYDLAVVGASLPSYATVGVNGGTPASWATSTTDVRGLQDPNDSGRSASTWYTFNTMTFDVNITDGPAHKLALYAVDWNGRGTQEQVQILDAATGTVLDTETLSNFVGGEYLQWTVSGHVQIKVTRQAGPTAIISGLFLD